MRSWRSSWRSMWGRYRCWRERGAREMMVSNTHTHVHSASIWPEIRFHICVPVLVEAHTGKRSSVSFASQSCSDAFFSSSDDSNLPFNSVKACQEPSEAVTLCLVLFYLFCLCCRGDVSSTLHEDQAKLLSDQRQIKETWQIMEGCIKANCILGIGMLVWRHPEGFMCLWVSSVSVRHEECFSIKLVMFEGKELLFGSSF